MRPGDQTPGTPRIWHLYLGLALIAVSVVVGMLNGWGLRDLDRDGATPAGGAGSAAETTDTSEAGADQPGADQSGADQPDAGQDDPGQEGAAGGSAAPTVLDWGGTGRQLAVVIRNDTDRTVRRAEVVITARAADGTVLARLADDVRSTCCTVLGLPPNERFGLFSRLPVPLARVADVDVEYRVVTFEPRRWDPPRVAVDGAQLRRTSSDTVVEARLRLTGRRPALRSLNGHVAGQAFLVDRGGDLVAVISGRFYCLTAEEPQRTVAMQLLRPVPPGTRLSHVVAYAVPRTAGLPVPHTCPAPTRPTE